MKAATLEQLLVLVDRAERGRLTAAEAARLREGIAALDTSRRSAFARLGEAERERRGMARQVGALTSVVRRTQGQGGLSVRLSTLLGVLEEVPGVGELAEEPRGRPSAPV